MGYNTFIPIVTNGLVLCLDAGNTKSYPGSGTTWTDLTSNGNNGTLVNGPTFNSSNVGSFVFNGSTTYVACGLAQSVGSDPTLPFSVSVWVKKNASNGAYQAVVERYQGITIANKFGWQIALDLNNGNYSVGDLSVQMNNSQVIDSYITATGSAILNEWKNVVFTYDGTNGYLYVDGVLKNSKAKPTGTISANSRNLNMGYTSVHNSNFVNGNVAYLLLYNRTLSASEVLQNYNATKLRYYTHIDADAQRFIDATQITTESLVSAVNLLVIDLKTYGIWDKMKAIYPVVGGTAFTHKFNLKDPRDSDAAFRLSFLGGGWTHSSTGAQPNGSTSYADTFLIPNTNLTSNSHHLSFYSRTNNTTTSSDLACQSIQASSTQYGYMILSLYSTGTSYYQQQTQNTNAIKPTEANTLGFYNGSRTSSTSFKAFKNGVLRGSNTNVASAIGSYLPINSIYLSAFNFNNNGVISTSDYSNRECSFASIGDGLTDTEAANFYTAVQAYQTRLGRNV